MVSLIWGYSQLHMMFLDGTIDTSEYQRVMHWRLIIEEFGTNIQNISGSDNIVSDTLHRLTYKSVDKYEPITIKVQCRTNKLFTISRSENNEDFFLLSLLNVKEKNKKTWEKWIPKLAHTLRIRGPVNPIKLLMKSR